MAGVWQSSPTPCSTEVKERVELYPYSPSGPSWPVLGRTLPLHLSRAVCNALRPSAQFGCQPSCPCARSYAVVWTITAQRKFAAIPGIREVPGLVSSRQNEHQQPRQDVHIFRLPTWQPHRLLQWRSGV